VKKIEKTAMSSATLSLGDRHKLLRSRIPGAPPSSAFPPDYPWQIRLEFLQMDGADDMYEYSKIPEFYNFLEYEPHKSIKETQTYLKKLIQRTQEGSHGGLSQYWFIRSLAHNKIIGTIGLIGVDFRSDSACTALGISPIYRGEGIPFEAFALSLDYCFNILKLQRMWAITQKENLPVRGLCTASGFTEEGVLRKYYKDSSGKYIDAVMLSCLMGEAKYTRCLGFARIAQKR
jgi:ribosomal-protein-alanine N-acetyltransferase